MKKTLILLLLAVAIPAARAQSPQLKFDHFGVREGLPEELPQFIQQDSLGYTWIGTQNGLVRYDGYTEKVYRGATNENRFKVNNSFLSMVADPGGNLWFSTIGNGLFRYNRSTDSFTQYPYTQLPGRHDNYGVYLLAADNHGNFWGLLYNYNLSKSAMMRLSISKDSVRMDEQKSIEDVQALAGIYNPFDGTSSGKQFVAGTADGISLFSQKHHEFRALVHHKDTAKATSISLYNPPSQPGVIWMGIYYGYSKKAGIERVDLRNKTVKAYTPHLEKGLSMANDSVNFIYEDTRHRLWFGTQAGLLLFDPRADSFICFHPDDSGNAAISTIASFKNGLLLATGKGLLYFDPITHAFKRYLNSLADPSSISSDVITNLLVDRTGTFWVEGNRKPIDKLNALTSAISVYKHSDTDPGSYPGENLHGIVANSDGSAFLTNKKGIYKWAPGSNSFLQVYKPKPGDNPGAVVVSKKGIIYFSDNNGLNAYDPVKKQLQTYRHNTGDTITLAGRATGRILVDHTGLVWIGTRDRGICCFDPLTAKLKWYPFIVNYGILGTHGELDDMTVLGLYEDREGTVWVGTNFGGLNRYDRKSGKFISFMYDGNTHVECISDMLEDADGHFWVATYLQGVFEFDRNSGHFTRHLDEDNGLLFNSTLKLASDQSGNLWVYTLRGISRIQRRTLAVKNYNASQLLPSETVTGWFLCPVGNKMVFAINDGVAIFDPRNLDANPYPPIVHIERLSYSNTASSVDSTSTHFAYGSKKLELPYFDNRITFNYVGIHLVNPAGIQYKYRLEGYDHHWINARGQRSATYTNLSPGTYTFHVTAANSDDVWNNTGDSFTVIINPPWWQTWWAWVLWIALFISAIYAFVAFRSRKLMHDKKVLEHKVQVRTEEVIQQKEEIAAQRDSLEQTLDELKTTQKQLIQSEKMASLGELTAGIAHEIQNPLNFVNNFSEVSVELLTELEEEEEKGKTAEVLAIAKDLSRNLQKISHHGKRAEAIVKGMLEHSRSSSGQKEPTDINQLADEYIRLSYHGLRAKDKSFNAELVTNFDLAIPKVNAIPQDIGRVLLNLFNNAFYAVNQKAKTVGADYKPEVSVTTSTENGQVIIKVKDNGIGIPDAIREKIMQPFFTTKPTGEGTGLGLSLTYDMVVKGHGGSINVESVEGEGSEFTILLPLS